MNTLVNFKLAKLLKEKGFNLYCNYSYWKGELTPNTPGYALEDGTTSQENYYDFERYYAPTIAEVVMWLYEKHGIWVKVDVASKDFWHPSIINIEDGSFTVHPSFVSQNFIEKNGRMFNTPTEAYEAAIEYTLTKILTP